MKMNLLYLARLAVKVPNMLFLKKIIKQQIPIDQFSYSYSSGKLYLKDIGCYVSKTNNLFVLNGYNFLTNLRDNRNAIIEAGDTGLVIKIDELVFNVNYWDELNILKEVFADGIYNYVLNEKMVLIDVGMNVAVTSLFFAKNELIEKIYSFEPFAKTFAYAIKNIQSNPAVGHKINPRNYGLDKSNQFVEVKYIIDNKGSVGVGGIPEGLLNAYKDNVAIEKIELRSGLEEFKSILAENEGASFIAKIDCEGSEYVIMQDLYEHGLLQKIKIFMIEWHEKGPSAIIELLSKAGFSTLSFGEHNSDVGMIYAVRP
jgi:FkbM family methyltransferase